MLGQDSLYSPRGKDVCAYLLLIFRIISSLLLALYLLRFRAINLFFYVLVLLVPFCLVMYFFVLHHMEDNPMH